MKGLPMTTRRPTPGQRVSARRGRIVGLLAVVALFAAACEGPRDREIDALGPRPTVPGQTTPDGSTPGTPIVDTSQCPGDPTTGISGDTIKFGVSLPQSGLYAACDEIRKGADAHFAYVNEQGGVEIAGKKYKIELEVLDDAYEVPRTTANVNRLINNEKVFGLFNVVGTKNNLAIRQTVNDLCVPNLFAGTGSPAWGNHEFPFTLGTLLTPYPLEAKAFADYLKENDPDATVAILKANDDFGKAYADTFKAQIEGSDITVVAESDYNPDNPDTKSQITSLAAQEADALLLAATLLGCPNSLSAVRSTGWEPLIYMSGTCTSKTIIAISGDAAADVISVAPVLDPADPANFDLPGMALYREKVPEFAPDLVEELDNSIVAYGWTSAAMLVDVLSRSPAADRFSVIETARSITFEDIGVMIPGTTMSTSAEDWFLGETFNLVQYSLADGFFKVISDGPIDESGKTAEVAGDSLVNA